jgi:hypothetical protein
MWSPLLETRLLSLVRGPLRAAGLAYVGAGGLTAAALVVFVLLTPLGRVVQEALPPPSVRITNQPDGPLSGPHPYEGPAPISSVLAVPPRAPAPSTFAAEVEETLPLPSAPPPALVAIEPVTSLAIAQGPTAVYPPSSPPALMLPEESLSVVPSESPGPVSPPVFTPPTAEIRALVVPPALPATAPPGWSMSDADSDLTAAVMVVRELRSDPEGQRGARTRSEEGNASVKRAASGPPVHPPSEISPSGGKNSPPREPADGRGRCEQLPCRRQEAGPVEPASGTPPRAAKSKEPTNPATGFEHGPQKANTVSQNADRGEAPRGAGRKAAPPSVISGNKAPENGSVRPGVSADQSEHGLNGQTRSTPNREKGTAPNRIRQDRGT